MALQSAPSHVKSSGFSAFLVASGIFLSRVAGLIRDRFFAHYFGNSEAAGAFRAALRIPNLLQNLFGEGSLSSSFIPVYSRLLADKREKEAAEVASTIFSLLLVGVSLLSAIGVVVSDWLIRILAPGFSHDDQVLTAKLVKILFPGAGLLVMSAWCLGVLNSHRRFFLSYLAPVLWNGAIVATMVIFGLGILPGGENTVGLVEKVAWGVVLGSFLQFAFQLPKAIRLNGGLSLTFRLHVAAVRSVFVNFVPSILSRGVVQVSAYLDQVFSSYLGTFVVAGLAYAQTLALLPISLFGMSIASAELPELSRIKTGRESGADSSEANKLLLDRFHAAVGRVNFFVVPSVVAIWCIGPSLVGIIYQTGEFNQHDVVRVWWLLLGYSIGILASTHSRLAVSVFWAMQNTKAPAKFAFVRVVVSAVLGAGVVFIVVPSWNISPFQGGALLAASSGFAGWVEYLLVIRKLRRILGSFAIVDRNTFVVCGVSILSGAIGVMSLQLPISSIVVLRVISILVFSVTFLAMSSIFKVPQATSLVVSISRRLRRAQNRR